MAQVASGGGWKTTYTLVNTSLTNPAAFRLNLFDDNGNPLTVPLNFPQNASLVGSASTLDRSLAPGAELIIETVVL
jgi:hypothetical protein